MFWWSNGLQARTHGNVPLCLERAQLLRHSLNNNTWCFFPPILVLHDWQLLIMLSYQKTEIDPRFLNKKVVFKTSFLPLKELLDDKSY